MKRRINDADDVLVNENEELIEKYFDKNELVEGLEFKIEKSIHQSQIFDFNVLFKFYIKFNNCFNIMLRLNGNMERALQIKSISKYLVKQFITI